MIEDDFPLTLDEACRLYPKSSYKVATLKAAADKGLLDIFLLGRRYHTTRAAMGEWVRRCQEVRKGLGFTSTDRDLNGPSETDRASSALAALRESTSRLKRSSPATSPRNTNRRVGQTH